MAIDFDSGSGVFDVLGKIAYWIKNFNSLQAATGSDNHGKEFNDILVMFDGETNDRREPIDDALENFNAFLTTGDAFKVQLRTMAQEVLIQRVDEVNPQPAKTVAYALAEFYRQMSEQGETVRSSAASVSTLVTGPRNGVVTGATQANPVVITSAAHGLSNGDLVSIVGVGGMTEINNLQFYAASVATNTFELRGVDGSGYTAFSSNGTWRAVTGHHVVIASEKDGRGRNLENALAEDLKVTCTAAATSGGEVFSILGEVDESGGDKLSHKWPSGSAASQTSVPISDPAQTGFLTNGDFEDFTTADTPDNWDIDTGVVSTTIKESADEYRGSSALEFDGNGSELTAISQDLSSAGMAARTPYPVSVRYKCDVVPAGGVLVIDLYDGSAVIADDAGTNNSLSIDLTVSETSYNVATAVFRLPSPLPSTIQIRVRLTTAVSSGSSLLIDDLILGPAMKQAYTAGPYIAIIRGDVDPTVDDEHTVAVANTRVGVWQEWLDRLFDTPESLPPSAANPSQTISDGLIA